MKVKELIEILEKQPQNAEVIVADCNSDHFTIEAIMYDSEFDFESGKGYEEVDLVIQDVICQGETLIMPNEFMVWKNPDYPWGDVL